LKDNTCINKKEIQCYPIFVCSANFFDMTKYFYEQGNLTDVNENTAEEICK